MDELTGKEIEYKSLPKQATVRDREESVSVTVEESELDLAPLFTLRDFDGSVSEYFDQLFAEYRRLLDAGIVLFGKPLVAEERQTRDGRGMTFWHLVTGHSSNGREASRALHIKKCAYLPRVCDVLRRLERQDPSVCCWRERNQVLMVASVDFTMVIRLRVVRGSWVIKAAYPIDEERQMRYMAKRAAAAWAR